MLDRFHKWLDSISVGLPRMPRISRTVCKDGRRGGGRNVYSLELPTAPNKRYYIEFAFSA